MTTAPEGSFQLLVNHKIEPLLPIIDAAFLCADLGITPETREDHAAYIASWLQILKKDNRAIFTAASHAQKAADYLNSYHSIIKYFAGKKHKYLI